MADVTKKYRMKQVLADNSKVTLHPETDADIVIVSEIKDGDETVIAAGSTAQQALELLCRTAKVIPNPESAATDSLTKIRINGTTYAVEGDGGGLLRGYYFRGTFYKDTTYSEELAKSNTAVYIDIPTGDMYTYCGGSVGFQKVSNVPEATDKLAGVLKLYDEKGSNVDGTITQKAITEGVSEISFAVDADDSECLVLNNAWAAE